MQSVECDAPVATVKKKVSAGIPSRNGAKTHNSTYQRDGKRHRTEVLKSPPTVIVRRRAVWVPPILPLLFMPKAARRHRDAVKRSADNRPSASARGYNRRWHKARAEWLRTHPLCAACLKANHITPATTVDHIKPHKGNQILFWDRSNWQSLCTMHHNQKSATEGG